MTPSLQFRGRRPCRHLALRVILRTPFFGRQRIPIVPFHLLRAGVPNEVQRSFVRQQEWRAQDDTSRGQRVKGLPILSEWVKFAGAMKRSWVFWLADYAAGIVAALSLGLVVLLIVAWVSVFNSHAILGAVSTVLAALIIALLIRAVPYVRKRADDRRQQEPEESLSGLLRELKQVRAEREMREKLRGRRR